MKKNPSSGKTKRRRITFSLEAPEAGAVYLVGDFNGWNAKAHPMKRDDKGRWSKQVMLGEGLFEYKFVVDDQWVTDPRNEQACDNCFGSRNSVVLVTV